MRTACYLLFLVGSFSLRAQGDGAITAHWVNAKFHQVVESIESQSRLHIFYDSTQTDSLRITWSVEQQPASEVLKKLFEGTDLAFSFFDSWVFITKGRQLYTNFRIAARLNNDSQSSSAVDLSEFEKRGPESHIEEKSFRIGVRGRATSGRATLTGIVKDIHSGEPIPGAAITEDATHEGVTTDPFGRFSITLSLGRHRLKAKSLGMKVATRQVEIFSDGKLDIELTEMITPLKEVLVQGERENLVQDPQMGMQKLDIKTMKQIPLALGETDILKIVTTLPGVQTVGEGTLGLNVRGGATSQNLILFNDGFVFNPSHFFGFFSTFNPDVIKSVELYKSGMTADYGGRLSSVLDIRSREGNLKKLGATGGISPVSTRLTIEGPILKGRTSFLLGFRSTYSDWVLRQVDAKSLKNSTASFYDVTLNLNHKIDESNHITVSGYASQDQFRLTSDTTYQYSNRNASINWMHVFNSKLFVSSVASLSQYQYEIGCTQNPLNAFSMNFSVAQVNLKSQFTYNLTDRHTVTGGLSTIQYEMRPGNQQPSGASSIVSPNVLQQEHGRESAAFIGDQFNFQPALSIYYGVRFSTYQYLGAKDVYAYTPNEPRSVNDIVDTLHYARGKPIANYGGFEPRVSARYTLSENASVKISYNRMRQYIQMLSNTTAITPTDVWKLSDSYIKPQVGDQFSIGFYRNLKKNQIEASVEAYYKTTQNTVDYKSGAVLLLNHHIETDVLNAKGKAYGIELLLRKPAGKLNGWMSYTFSRSFLQTVGVNSSETVNNGNYYPSNYDKPHAFNFIGNYKINRRFNFSINAIYSTGRPITLPIGKYVLNGSERIFYSDRNQYRIPDYFRMDASINVEGNHKVKKLAHSSWTFAIYNLLGRHNAYSVYYVSQGGSIQGYQLSVFARPIPTVTYNFKF